MLAGFLAGQHRFTAAEVNAVAAEITGEIGPQADRHAAARAAVATRPAERHPDLIGNVRRLLNMADRVDRLEKDVNEVLKLVRMLVEPERAQPGRRAAAAGSAEATAQVVAGYMSMTHRRCRPSGAAHG